MCAKSADVKDAESDDSEQGSDGKVELLIKENMLLKFEKKELAEALSRATAVDSNTISLYRTEYDVVMGELGRLKCANAELEATLLMKRRDGDSEDEGVGSEPCTVRRDELEWLRQQVTAQRSTVAALEVALEAQSASLRSLADRHSRATQSRNPQSEDQRGVAVRQLTDYQPSGATGPLPANDGHTTVVPLPGIVAIEETKLKGLLKEVESRSKEVLELRAEVCSSNQMLHHRGTTSEQRDQVVLSRREYADLLGEAQEARQQRTVPDLHREIDAQVYERKMFDLRAQIASYKAQLVAMKLVNNILPVLEKRGLLKRLIEGAEGDRLEDIVTVQELKIRDLRRTIANLICLHRAAKPFTDGLEVVLSAKPIRPPPKQRYLSLEDIKSDDDSTSADDSPRLGPPGTGCRLQRPKAFRASPPIDHSTAVYRRGVGGISFHNFWWKRRLQKAEDAVVDDDDVDFYHQEPMLRTGTIPLSRPAPRARRPAPPQPRRRRYRGTEEASEVNASSVYITIPQPYMYR
ncbi:hypothetical protein FOL47_002247 [Perkinsus chesapeaki]|uniref:Uncharacterized protein n=1 Tax=Perkinsus chesapeaki TaxID=330153 RepID=A0A7J6N0A6_PERCH|nr:hypothetical protein FOL47_002247 [Perkinsus chesapeaki]